MTLFCFFSNTSHIDSFLQYLNFKHPNIKFTWECGNDATLSFLDIKIQRGNSFSTSTYRKPTYTGLYTLFSSFIPEKYTHYIVQMLVYCIVILASSVLAMHADLENLKATLLKNGYPLTLIHSKIRYVLDKVLHPPRIKHSCSKKCIFVSLPFTGNHGLQFRTKLYKLFRTSFPKINPKVIFKPSFHLSNFFPLKHRAPLDVSSLVEHQYTCRGCNATYIGKTKRHLRQRVCEHRGISYWTNQTIAVPPHSSIRDHYLDSGHTICPDNFKIIARCTDVVDLSIRENLLIMKHRPELNVQSPITELYLFSD